MNLWSLTDALVKKGDQKSVELAAIKGEELCQLFGLWCGFDTISTITTAIQSGVNNGPDQIIDQPLSLNTVNDTLFSDPLFNGVRLDGSKSTASIMERIMDLLRMKDVNER